MILFGLFFIMITGLIHYYIWKRLVKDTALNPGLRFAGTISVAALAISIPATMMTARMMSAETAKVVSFMPLLWMGTMLFVVTSLVMVDLFFLVRYLIGRFSSAAGDVATAPIDSEKRQSLKKIAAAGTLGLSGSLSAASFITVQKDATVIRQDIRLAKLPEALNGLRMVQISDIHIGLTLDGEYLSHVVSKVNSLKPDLIVITGDLVDGYVNTLQKEVRPLAALKAPQGVFFVTGNHEYYFRANEWTIFLQTLGILVLDNRAVEIGDVKHPLLLAGVNDYQANRFDDVEGLDLEKALAGRNAEQEVVLLCHQPKIIHDAAQADVGLVLSGHTHGGQIWPFNYLVRLQQPFLKGHIQYNHRSQLYINQGTGYWGPPMRLGTTSEITLITLHREEN